METINLTAAKEMVARYATTRKTLIDDTYSINDTKSIWYSVEDFKSYAANLPNEATGVRVHLAVYGDDDALYPKQTTVIFTATINNDNGAGDVDNIGSTTVVLNDDPANKGKLCPPDCP